MLFLKEADFKDEIKHLVSQQRMSFLIEVDLRDRNQAPSESAEEYIMALYKLAEDCKYGNMKSKMIRDRLVVGIRNSSLSESFNWTQN